jgi:aminomethyltransferase
MKRQGFISIDCEKDHLRRLLNSPEDGPVPLQTPLHEQTSTAGATFADEAGWQLPAHFGDAIAEYRHARENAVIFDVSHRGKIELVGPDAQRFLHNLCTNEILKLPVGAGCEALLANAKAKVIARFFAFHVRSEAGVEDVWLDLDPGIADKTLKHLDRFLISEQVELSDRTADFGQVTVAGPEAAAVLERALGQPFSNTPVMHCETVKFPAGTSSQVRRHDSLGVPAFDILTPRTYAEEAWKQLLAAGARPAGVNAYHVLRVEAGTPWYGQDIDENNLAMELNRTAQAISYGKGCFPGQEPIVRARDLGHVNWMFSGLKLAGAEVPPPGSKLFRQDKEVGRVTSAVFSPRGGGILALGYIRRGNDTPGTTLEVDAGGERRSAEVASLPFFA